MFKSYCYVFVGLRTDQENQGEKIKEKKRLALIAIPHFTLSLPRKKKKKEKRIMYLPQSPSNGDLSL